jgi:hypothetical protein
MTAGPTLTVKLRATAAGYEIAGDGMAVPSRSDSRGLRTGIAIRRFHRRRAGLTRTRLVGPFKKGDRPLCPLKMHFGRLRDCGLGTEWSVPFFEPRMPFSVRGKNRAKNWVSPELVPFREPGTEAVCSVFSTSRVCVGGRDFSIAGPNFSSIWSTNSGGLYGRPE